jgi:H+-transporting ATPase
VGITGEACSSERLREDTAKAAADCGIFGGVFPEDKYRLVQALQNAGHVSGMTGDGVNDAPALRQAEVGIAVANATDVAKAAASIVLTNPGLTDVVAAIETSRRIYQRMLTYTLNKIIKTIEIAVFLSLGMVLTRTLVVTPVLIVLLLFTNDFLTMSIATDHVSFSQRPERWSIRTLMLTAAPLAGLLVLFSLAALFTGLRVLQLRSDQIPTLVFLTMVFGGQGTVYLVRERGHFWCSRPSAWMLCSSCADIAIVSVLAMMGVLMSPVRGAIVLGLLISVLLYLAAVDFFKVRIFRLFGVR